MPKEGSKSVPFQEASRLGDLLLSAPLEGGDLPPCDMSPSRDAVLWERCLYLADTCQSYPRAMPFTDPDSGEVVAPGSLPHRLGDFVMAVLGAGFTLRRVGEYAPDAEFVRRYPRAERYLG